MNRTLLALSVVFTLLFATPPISQAQSLSTAEPASAVTARGTARVYRKPDHLDVIVGVETIGATAGEAHEKCANDMQAVLRSIKDMGLAAIDLKTGTVDLQPRYERRDYEQGPPAKIIGYRAINTVRIRTADLKAAPKIIDAALKAGANRVDGVMFGIKEVLEPREEALRMATRAAKRKAAVMAESLDVSLDKVLNISETTQQFGGWSNRSNLAQVQMANESGPVAGEESIEPGMIEIVVDVTLTYSLKP